MLYFFLFFACDVWSGREPTAAAGIKDEREPQAHGLGIKSGGVALGLQTAQAVLNVFV